MTPRPDQLHATLQALLDRISARDALGAQAAMEEALARFGASGAPVDDPRLAALFATCEAAARRYHAELGEELRDSATKARASQAYSRGSTR